MTTQVLAVLRAKRIEVMAQVRETETKLARLRAALANLDAAASILTPGHPDHVPAKGPYKRTGYFNRNELPRIMMDTLRKTRAPMTAGEIAAAALKLKGLPASAQDNATRHVLVVLGRLVKRGWIAKTGVSRNAKWAAVPAGEAE